MNNNFFLRVARKVCHQRFLQGGVTAALLLGVSMGAYAPDCSRAAVIVPGQKASSVESQMAEMDAYLATNSMFKAIKQVDLPEYNRFRALVRKGIESGKNQEEMYTVGSQFGNEYLQMRLRHASPSTIKKYLIMRADFMERIATISPDVAYSMLTLGKLDISAASEETHKKIEAATLNLSDKIASIIIAPSSIKPVHQDEALINKNLLKIRSLLNLRELAELGKGEKPGVDHSLYCKAVVHLYREGIKLPDVQAVQLFRYIGAISQDDRIK